MKSWCGSQLLENAQRIFDVARAADAADLKDFALLIRPDGSLHFVMEAPFSIEAAAIHAGARSAFRVTRSREGVRVEGHSASRDCIIEERRPVKTLLPD